MREKDWRKRREELRQYMGGSMSAKPKNAPKSKELFLFRLYVTVILAGGLLLVSLFHSETAEKSHPAGERYHCIRNALGKNSGGRRTTDCIFAGKRYGTACVER